MSFLTRTAASPRPAPPTGFSLLDTSVLVTGDIETAGSVRIDGRLDGNVTRADVVVVGAGATVTGDIHAREVIIGGTLNGSVHATERVELQATAVVTGDLVAQSVLMQEGGVVNGRILMRPPEGGHGTSRGSREPAMAGAVAEPVRG